MGTAALTPDRTRSGLTVLTLVVLSAFGPYIAAGLRTEQLVVYGIAVPVLAVTWFRLRLTPVLAVFAALWSVVIAVAVIGWAFPPVNTSSFAAGRAIANLDNLALPLVTVLLVVAVVAPASREAVLRRATGLIAVGMCLNAVVALGQMLNPASLALVSRWWSGGNGQETVGDRALTLGRYTGIMNQPALAGVAYSIAMMCAIYYFRGRPVRLGWAVALIALGGALAVSKAFLLIGLPVAGWHLLRMSGKRGTRLILAGFSTTALFSAASLGYLDRWVGLERLLMSVPGFGQANRLGALTGNRYGETAATRPLVDALLEHAPWFGMGMRGLDAPTDSAWVQVLVLSGLVGLGLFVAALGALAQGYWRQRTDLPEVERRLFAGLLVVTLASSIGFPVLTANRVGVLGGVLFALLLIRRAPEPEPTEALSESRVGQSSG